MSSGRSLSSSGYDPKAGGRKDNRRRKLLVAAVLFCAATVAVGASLAAPPADSPAGAKSPVASDASAHNAWRRLFEQDLEHLASIVPTHYIYAVHPGGPEWNAQFQQALSRARREAALVHDFGSYRAVLQHFVVSFQDAHFSAYFNVGSRQARWPRFSVQYQGGRYIVTQSQLPAVGTGAAVTSCDGRAMHDWMDGLAEFFGGPPGLETTRAAIARQVFVDLGNPLYDLPRSCRIGEHEVVLDWVVTTEDAEASIVEPIRTSSSAPTLTDADVRIDDFGAHGAWVRIGTMAVMTEEKAGQFRRIIDGAAGLRDKDTIVIDVRGNSGGTYNWFMAFLRALYGQEYADYFARARLEISNTLLVLSVTGADDPGFSAEANRVQVPPDPPMSTPAGEPRIRKLANGSRLVSMRAPIEVISYADRPPANPVRARVYVLTDYGCGSACLSFMDEMMRFPGVIQIGAETHIDRRSGGWPEAFQLPSGLAFVRMGRMVREGRRRGENEAWIPSYRFPGNIADTDAVKRWIVQEVLPHGAVAADSRQ